MWSGVWQPALWLYPNWSGNFISLFSTLSVNSISLDIIFLISSAFPPAGHLRSSIISQLLVFTCNNTQHTHLYMLHADSHIITYTSHHTLQLIYHCHRISCLRFIIVCVTEVINLLSSAFQEEDIEFPSPKPFPSPSIVSPKSSVCNSPASRKRPQDEDSFKEKNCKTSCKN